MTTELNLNAFEFKTIISTKRAASLDKKQTFRFPKHGYHLFRKAFHPKKLDFQNMDTICSEKHFIQKLGAVYIRMHIQMKSKFRCNVYHHRFLHLTMQFWEYKRGPPTRLSQYVFKPGVLIQDEQNHTYDCFPWWLCVSCCLLQNFNSSGF